MQKKIKNSMTNPLYSLKHLSAKFILKKACKIKQKKVPTFHYLLIFDLK